MPTPAHACPKCAGEVREGWRVCPVCAAPLHLNADAETKTIFHESSSASSVEEGRFPAGTVLAGRYRVLGLIGQGGMGEVYRAYDLILNQAVALKFLGKANMSEAALARFRNEVRIARQVSHPNVCRVYDIGFIEGFHFLSMEYLDGEDLASLIRRIGRLPQDKAIEFTRKICAGLAAAHDRGVLHRDLKPANIMIDSRGQVRITDFGLAALAQEVALGDIRSGTPAYMSPEQKTGKEVSVRSDIYSLGLTLHEMFTGKRRGDTQTNPTDIVKDLDPAVERVILRCIEEDPKRRPSSSLSVAMAMPGGDPIAAALAAGETPSPEMVAASGEKEGFSTRTAVLCFVGIVVFLAIFASAGRFGLLAKARLDVPPEVLEFQAQGILKQLGYVGQPQSVAYGFDCCDRDNLRFAEQQGSRRYAILASHQPPVLRFWYRQHQAEFTLDDPYQSEISFKSPPNTEPGMIRLALDAKGRLVALEARPDEAAASHQNETAPDGLALFTAAGLDRTRFTAATPRKVPPMATDTRLAWIGSYASGRPEQVHVEAAFWEGRAVFFDIAGDWPRQQATNGISPTVATGLTILTTLIVVGGALVARHNLRLGRGDRRSAARVASVFFLVSMGEWLLTATHLASSSEIVVLFEAIGKAGFGAGMLWVGYIAVEPYVRRQWPDSLISWTRLLTGRIRDPLVASHVLAGFLLVTAASVLIAWANILVSAPLNVPVVSWLNSTGYFVDYMLGRIVTALGLGFFFLLLVVLLRLLVRRVWIADVLACVIIGLGVVVDYSNPFHFAVTAAVPALSNYASLWVLRRFGLLAWLAIWYLDYASWVVLLTTSPASWYAGRVLVAGLIPVAIAAWALWVILSAQRRPTESAG